jgi:hypothetical protein
VPDPDITSLSNSTSEDFESGPEEELIQRVGCLTDFNRLSGRIYQAEQSG